MKCDLDKYRPFVAKFDMPPHQKDEIIQMVFNRIQNTIDRACGDDSAQLALDKKRNNSSKDASEFASVVDLDHSEYSRLEFSKTQKGDAQ